MKPITTTGLEDLRVDCVIGVHPHEREAEQQLVVSVELDYDSSAAAASDSIDDAIDYARVAEELTELAQRRQYRLLECYAEEAAVMLFERHERLVALRLKIRKPAAVPAARCSFVRVARERG